MGIDEGRVGKVLMREERGGRKGRKGAHETEEWEGGKDFIAIPALENASL